MEGARRTVIGERVEIEKQATKQTEIEEKTRNNERNLCNVTVSFLFELLSKRKIHVIWEANHIVPFFFEAVYFRMFFPSLSRSLNLS